MSRSDRELVESILSDAVVALNSANWITPGGVATAGEFEKQAFVQLQAAADARGSGLKLRLHSGRKFPDIVFEGTEYGVEIKTAKKGWECLGNSVKASTLVDGVREVYLIFGSGDRHLSVRYARYEDCVKAVEVTHSPRYVLDMEIAPSASYLAAIGTTLAGMLACDDPIARVVAEARSKLKKGEHLWWISDNSASPLMIKHWKNLSKSEKSFCLASAFVFFPDSIMKRPKADYESFIAWLFGRKSVMCGSVRDNFTSGGVIHEFDLGGYVMESAPRILSTLREHLAFIDKVIDDSNPEEWADSYGIEDVSSCENKEQRFAMWRSRIEPLILTHCERCDDYVAACIRSFLDAR